ncbi:MAG: bifunctional glutamate N-acetyltransferase/amino-acid acetyltransferase ArgJ [Ruminococcus sp.]|nr:bifunctional glutamate N-acetyltransferase/amino-acid acetyltransferase ArgJ [Ruminococcus sp.]
MKIINGGVASAKGFETSSVEANIKYKDRKDMALIYSESPCKMAGTFTKNVVKASCVLWDKELNESGTDIHAVVVNSGVANACTGKQGYDYCMQTAQAVSKVLPVKYHEVLVASTGVIGMQLPIDKITNGVDMLSKELEHSEKASLQSAQAIMTTDTKPKHMAIQFDIDGKTVTIGGMCKGSGMIHPNMCTMLSFITTDISISKELLQEALSTDILDTYNMISVDGDTSTNDTVLLLANGLAGNKTITEKNDDYYKFLDALHHINEEFAKKIASDGEGATALVQAKVINAKTKDDARTIAKSIICSSLTKCAIFGHDANWGRILCAMGYSGVDFNPDNVEVSIADDTQTILIFKDGSAVEYSEDEASKILSKPVVNIIADIKMGNFSAIAYGCDLSYDYVKINADYRS